MDKKKKILNLVCIFLTASIVCGGLYLAGRKKVEANSGITYYISSSRGNDANDGTDISSPWKTFTNLRNMALGPGDEVLLRRGDTWNSRMTVVAKGTKDNWVYIGPYGDINDPAPLISLGNHRDDIAIVVQDLMNKAPYSNGISYVHVDNLRIKNSRIGIYFRAVVTQESKGIKVTNCYFENMNCEPVMTAMLDSDNVAGELNMAKGNLDTFSGATYSESGGGAAEYVWPGAILIGGRRGHPESRIGFSEIEIHNNIFEQCINGVLAYYYNLPSETNFFKNMNMSNCEITGTVNGILAVQGMDAGNPQQTADSEWGVFKNLNIKAGHPEMAFSLGVTGLIIEDFANALFTDCNFSNIRNNGYPDGCGFDFESRTRNVTIRNSIFANNQGQGILMMDNSRGPHHNITIRDSLFYNNLQSVTGNGYRWDLTIWNSGNVNIQLINNRHVSKINTSGTHTNRINSNERIIFEGPRSYGTRTDGITETGASFRRNDTLTDFFEEVEEKQLQNALKEMELVQTTNNPPIVTQPSETLPESSYEDSTKEESVDVSESVGEETSTDKEESSFEQESGETSESSLTEHTSSKEIETSKEKTEPESQDTDLSSQVEETAEDTEKGSSRLPFLYAGIFILIIAGGIIVYLKKKSPL